MAEAIAVVGFISAIASLADYGTTVVKRFNELRKNVKGLPSNFHHINVQLPLLVNIVHCLHDQSERGELTPDTASLLKPVLEELHKELQKLDAVISKIQPSADASTLEKSVKAFRSVGAQKDVDEFAAVIRDYVANLTAFQTTHNSDVIRRLEALLAAQNSEISPTDSLPTKAQVWLNKFDNDSDFIGRGETMADIERQLQEKNHRVALAGIGGVGKSRIAIQYCYRFRQQFPEIDIFWVYGGSLPRFETDYQRIAIALNIPKWEDQGIDTLRQVCDWLSDPKNGPWLMVLDNADDHDLWLGSSTRAALPEKAAMPLIDYLPRCDHGGIIVTTRDSQLGYRLVECKQDPIQVMRFEPEEARILLRSKLSEDKDLSLEDTNELTQALEYLPLTITQAAAYLRQIDISASEYLELFRKGEADIPNLLAESIDDPGRDRETSNSVFQTWKMSFDQILKQSPAAADMLSLMAMLDRQAISPCLLQGPDVPLIHFKAAVSKLKAFSLITEEKMASKYSIHRLVQLSTQKWLEHHDRLLIWEQAALAAVARLYPSEAEYQLWPLIRDLNAHVQTVLKYSITTAFCQVARANILHGLGHYLIQQGQDTSAREVLEECQELRQENLGPEHEDTLATLGFLGVLYNKLNRWEEAYKLQVYLCETTERALGWSHRLTFKCRSRLAVTYSVRREHSQAEALQQQTLEAMERELGSEDSVTMTEMTNLTYTYIKLRKWEDAENLGLRTLDLRTRINGPTHPDTLTTMANLAWIYREQWRWEEAEQLLQKTLEHRMEALGPDHPKTLQSMFQLARFHNQQGRWAKAEALQQEVVEVYQRISGPTHSDTMRAEENLARLKWARNRDRSSKSSSSRLAPSDAERRPRAHSWRPGDSSQPSQNRRRNGGSLSPRGRGPDYYRPSQRQSVSPNPERGNMDWATSTSWRQR